MFKPRWHSLKHLLQNQDFHILTSILLFVIQVGQKLPLFCVLSFPRHSTTMPLVLGGHPEKQEYHMHILNAKQVTQITNLSRVTLWRLERSGKFPKRINISANRIGWLEEDIANWIDNRPRGICAGGAA